MYKILVSCKIRIARGRPFARAFRLWLMEVYTQLFLLCTILMLMFEDMLKVYSGPAAIFSNLSLQRRCFHKFYYFSDHVYFQLPWVLKPAVAEALKLPKITVTFRHISCTGQIFGTGFKGDVVYL